MIENTRHVSSVLGFKLEHDHCVDTEEISGALSANADPNLDLIGGLVANSHFDKTPRREKTPTMASAQVEEAMESAVKRVAQLLQVISIFLVCFGLSISSLTSPFRPEC